MNAELLKTQALDGTWYAPGIQSLPLIGPRSTTCKEASTANGQFSTFPTDGKLVELTHCCI